MAAAWRSKVTGEGDTVGKRGVFATELWIVQVDSEGDDPIPILASYRPLNQKHPDASLSSARVVDWQKIERTDNPLTWRCVVIYQTDQSLGLGSSGGWRVATRWETRTEHLTRSLPEYNDRGQKLNDGRLIGPHHYRKYDPETDPLYTHIAPDPTTGLDIQLVQTPGIRPVGFDRIATAMHFTMSYTARSMTFQLRRYIKQKFAGKVNSETWQGFPPGTLLFSGFTQDEDASIDPARNVPMSVYPVAVEFAYKEDLWTPAEFVETYVTEDGIEVAVQAVDAPPQGGAGPIFYSLEIAKYNVYDFAPISQVFNVLTRGSVPTDPDKRTGDIFP